MEAEDFRTRRVESEPLRSRSPGCPQTDRTYPRFLLWSDVRPEGVRFKITISLVFVSVVHKECSQYKDVLIVIIWYVQYDPHLRYLMQTYEKDILSHLKSHNNKGYNTIRGEIKASIAFIYHTL